MDPNRLTEKSQEALRAAQALAARLSHQQIDNEHLLAALLEQEKGVVPDILLRAGVDLENLHRRLMADLEKLPKVAVSQGAAAGMYLTQHLERTFADAEQEAKKRRDEFVSVELLLVALFGQGGKAAELLREAGVTTEKLEQAVKEIRGNHG
jgi:ATP-dependent Clp protease ATP-binding subunit ClpB